METLTKENFWNEMEQKYPKAMAHFKEWVDNYKSEHYWNVLFNHISTDRVVPKGFDCAPKYHELPIAMQFGIFTEYMYYWSNFKNPIGPLKEVMSIEVRDFNIGVPICIKAFLSWQEGRL
jgi:hypothetical protein